MNKPEKSRQRARIIWWGLGMAGVLLTVIPYILLGEDGIYTYADQLDGELIAYILQAKHLFQGDAIPEFMNGMSKAALTLPAPLAVLLFLPGNYCAALFVMALVGKLCGYMGMYLLARDLTGEAWTAAILGFLYSCIPFLPVYGLAQYGLPMLFWCVLLIREGKRLPRAYCGIVIYGLCSSLILIGFGILGMGAVWILWQSLRRKGKEAQKRSSVLRLWAAWALLLLVYLGENRTLLGQLLGGGTEFVSHKADYVLEGGPFLEILRDSLLSGGQHSEGYHLLLLAYILFAVVLGWVGLRCEKAGDSGSGGEIKAFLKIIGFCFGWNLFFAFVAAFWKSGWGVELRFRLSFLGAFQLDRVLWIAPCLWYLAAACAAGIVCSLGRRRRGYRFALLPMIALAALTAAWTLYSGDFKTNLQKLRNPDYGMLSYRDYYAIGVMEQAREFLDAKSQKNMEEYRVVSLGIDPAAALYHGFYCLDGYSNNYSLEYKRKFREIIAPELDRNDYLKQYFDNWGNRCYLFSSEIPGYYTVEKNGFSFQDYHINAKALYELGGRYLLSAAYIQNAEEQGLFLLNETPFETPDSYYRIFIYEVAPDKMISCR